MRGGAFFGSRVAASEDTTWQVSLWPRRLPTFVRAYQVGDNCLDVGFKVTSSRLGIGLGYQDTEQRLR